jgi:hypothetical protein
VIRLCQTGCPYMSCQQCLHIQGPDQMPAGLHGANRLASNSLLEGLVFAARAVKPSVEHLSAVRSSAPLVSCPT